MFTMSYPFRPWRGTTAIADGASFLDYLRETAREHGVNERIRYNRRVVAASWSGADACWRVEVERTDTGEREQLTAGSSSAARATTATTWGTRPSSQAASASGAGSCIPSTGPRTSTTRAGEWS